MSSQPKVSVVIPTYNRSQYLCEALDSIMSQTFQPWEALVVDDGSMDDTESVVRALPDPRVRYLRQRHQGRSVARNHGLSQARGEFIAFLDDDDLYLPHKLSVQVAFLDRHTEIGLVSGGVQIIAADGALLREWHTWRDQPNLTLSACLYACPLLTCTVLLRRQWVEVLDHWFDPAMDRAEDTDFWIRLLYAGCCMDWTHEIVSAYRWHESHSQQDNNRYYHSFIRLYDKLFARPDLPESVRVEQPLVYTIRHTVGACQAYAAGEIDKAQGRLAMVAKWRPATSEDLYATVAKSVAEYACSDTIVDPHRFIELVFDHLPDVLTSLKSYRGRALSSFYMKRVFDAQKQGRRARLRDWLRGVYYDPRWLRNLGVWSILIRNILLRKTAGSMV